MRQGDLHILDMFSLDELAGLLKSIPDEVLSDVYVRAGRDGPGSGLSTNTGHPKGSRDTVRAEGGGVGCVC